MVPDQVREMFPWPELAPGITRYMVNLDFGGRELIVDLIRKRKSRIILEIGSFLGGSTRQWLAVSPDVQVVAVDPWVDGFAGDWLAQDLFWFHWPKPARSIVRQLNRKDGLYQTFLANLVEHRDQIVPVKKKSEDCLEQLAELGLRPDLIYIDADKKRDDLDACGRLFPAAILTGDDYLWTGNEEVQEATPRYPMQDIVRAYARDHDLEVNHRDQTWVLAASPGIGP